LQRAKVVAGLTFFHRINKSMSFYISTPTDGAANPVWNAGALLGIQLDADDTPANNDVLKYDSTANLWQFSPGLTGHTGYTGYTGYTGPSSVLARGTATLVAGEATVNTAVVTATTPVMAIHTDLGASTAIGVLRIGTIVPSTSFVISSTNPADASVQTNDISVISWVVHPSS
jgi:hypothetical protein